MKVPDLMHYPLKTDNLTETKFKMAAIPAILDVWRWPSSKGTFLSQRTIKSYLTETTSNMAAIAAILDVWRWPFSKGIFMETNHQNHFRLNAQMVLKLYDGNQNVNGHRCSIILRTKYTTKLVNIKPPKNFQSITYLQSLQLNIQQCKNRIL